MKPTTLMRVIDASEWDLLMNELRYLQGERAAVVAWLRGEAAGVSDTRSDLCWNIRGLSNCIERGEHRREEER
jgi:hypothetical protein